ncbi:MAG: hypothetical protein GY798_07280 [Hyphomicrobiales bacterium]|nr:hypothetical protein [Hyphomicrobiales bacterium]
MALAPATLPGAMTARADNTGAVIGGVIAGAAIGAAVSSAINHPPSTHSKKPPPTPSKPNPWADAYKPTGGIKCYPAQQACYNNGGAFNANWTHKVYGK